MPLRLRADLDAAQLRAAARRSKDVLSQSTVAGALRAASTISCPGARSPPTQPDSTGPARRAYG